MDGHPTTSLPRGRPAALAGPRKIITPPTFMLVLVLLSFFTCFVSSLDSSSNNTQLLPDHQILNTNTNNVSDPNELPKMADEQTYVPKPAVPSSLHLFFPCRLVCLSCREVLFAYPKKKKLANFALTSTASLPSSPTAFRYGTTPMPLRRSTLLTTPQRGLVGPIISRFEQRGYKLVAIKLTKPGAEHLKEHYADLKDKPFFAGLVEYMNSGPICAMVWQGRDAVKTGRTLLGATNPLASAPGTIRGDFAIDVGRNVCHGSDSVENAKKEIALWFKAGEVVDWSSENAKWIYEKP
ncbi:hypothetical protein RB595_008786 [Gaeumannomyces hyphopodioides]